MDYLKKYLTKTKPMILKKLYFVLKNIVIIITNLIKDLILDDQIIDKLKIEVTEGKLIQFQKILIKEKGNDINDKLWKAFSSLDINQNKNELIKSLNEV